MKRFSRTPTAKKIAATALTALMAVSASVGMCVSTVCADELPANLAICGPMYQKMIHKWEDKYAIAYLFEDARGCSYGSIIIKDTSIWDTEDGLTYINGLPISGIIASSDKSGYISSIKLEKDDDAWFYDYTISVTGRAGDGSFQSLYSEYLDINFIDGENDRYNLTIRSTTDKEHTVWYNSNDHKITRIEWSEGSTSNNFAY